MNKFLHERLREVKVESCGKAVAFVGRACCEFDSCEDCYKAVCSSLADEIERYYIPRPRYEDGEPVEIGDWFEAEDDGVAKTNEQIAGFGPIMSCFMRITCATGNLYDVSDGELLKRPAPKVLDADGVEINVGDVVWDINNGCEHEVIGLPRGGCYQSVEIRNVITGSEGGVDAPLLTHTKPAFDADGERIYVGDMVWTVNSMAYSKVKAIVPEREASVGLALGDGGVMWFRPDIITHREPDSLEKLRDDLMAAHESWDGDPNKLVDYADRLTALMERGA